MSSRSTIIHSGQWLWFIRILRSPPFKKLSFIKWIVFCTAGVEGGKTLLNAAAWWPQAFICFKGVHVCAHVAARNAAWAAEPNRLHGAKRRKTCAVAGFEWHSREVACDAALSNLRETHQLRLVFARWRRRTGRRHEKQTSGNTEWRRRDCETPCSFVGIVKIKNLKLLFLFSRLAHFFLRFCKKNYCNTLADSVVTLFLWKSATVAVTLRAYIGFARKQNYAVKRDIIVLVCLHRFVSVWMKCKIRT